MDPATWVLLAGIVMALAGWVASTSSHPRTRSFSAACSASGLWFLGAAAVWDSFTLFSVILMSLCTGLALAIIVKEALTVRKESKDGEQS